MTELISRIPRNPRDGSCRHALVPGARIGQRGFAPRTDGPDTGYQPAFDGRLQAGFRLEVRTT
jgi:hypothetical protein